MIPFRTPSFYFACFVPVVFFIAFRLISSFRVANAVVSLEHHFAKIQFLPRTSERLVPLTISRSPDPCRCAANIDALKMSAIGEVFRIQKPVSIVENWFLRCSTYWDIKAAELCFGILKAGPMPKHIALIMDGNRRYSRKTHATLEQGYICGCAKVKEVCCGVRDSQYLAEITLDA